MIVSAFLSLALASTTVGPSAAGAQSAGNDRARSDIPAGFNPALLRDAEKAIRLRNPKRAVELWRQAAKLGDPEAEYHLGNAYRNGAGVEKDPAQAVRWYQQAAAKRHPDAQFALGSLYEYGRGVPTDRQRAIDLYREAARAGHSEAKRRLASFGPAANAASGGGSGQPTTKGLDPNHALAQAVHAGDLSAARDALARGASAAGPRDERFPEPLLREAIRRDSRDLVVLLLEHHADPNAPLDSGETLLVQAVREASAPVVQALLRAGARPDERLPNGSTALHEAARVGKIDVASDLLAGGASAKIVLEDGTSAAEIARRFGHDRLASLLRQKGAPARSGPDITTRGAGSAPAAAATSNSNRPGELPPIVEAGRRGDVELIRKRLAAGDSVDLRDAEGESALGRAAEGGHVEAVALLLASRADANASDEQGRTPLLRAAASRAAGSDPIVESLLRAGADPNARDRRARGIAYYLAESATRRKVEALQAKGTSWTVADLTDAVARAAAAERSESLSALLSLSDDPKIRSRALCDALEAGRAQIAQTLLESGADASAACEDGARPLIAAARSGDDALVGRLLAAGADPAAASRSGDTALIAAASRGHVAVVRRLLAAGAAVDQRGEHKSTALMAASANGHLAVVEPLLAAGANPLHRDESSHRAADLAEAAGHPDVVARLRNTGTGWRSWVGGSEKP